MIIPLIALQDVAASVGVRRIRYAKGENHCDREKDLSHAYMRMDLSKCINCSRCVRACDEVQGQFTLTMTGRGFESRITTDNDMLFGHKLVLHLRSLMYFNQNQSKLIKLSVLYVHTAE